MLRLSLRAANSSPAPSLVVDPDGPLAAGGVEGAAAPITIQFAGTGAGYFRVFMFNSLMTVLSFGLYSPWARVRKQRYFYGHTTVLGSAFDFDASPFAILCARIMIVVLLFLALQVDTIAIILPTLGLGQLLLLLLLPIALVRGRAFNARHTLFRGVRFAYQRRYGMLLAVVTLLILPLTLLSSLLTIFSVEDLKVSLFLGSDSTTWQDFALPALLGWIVVFFPNSVWLWHASFIKQLSLGTLQLRFLTEARSYYVAFGHALLASALILGLMGLVSVLGEGSDNLWSLAFGYVLVGVVAAIGLYNLLVAMLSKRFWSGICFSDGTRISSTIRVPAYTWLLSTNTLLSLVSLSLLHPWAKVRRWRYLCASLQLIPGREMKPIQAGEKKLETPVGAELADLGSIDFDIGVI